MRLILILGFLNVLYFCLQSLRFGYLISRANLFIKVRKLVNKYPLISSVVPVHNLPDPDKEFGHYLAGLIDGDGCYSKYTISICFALLDLPLATYIQTRLGFGKISKIKGKNAYNLAFYGAPNLTIILNLVNGKLRIQKKCDSAIQNIISIYSSPLTLLEPFHINTSTDLNNA
jgi:hypothetical protein